MSTSHDSLAQLLDASSKWWIAAGVDQRFSDDATVWLADDAPSTQPGPQKQADDVDPAFDPGDGGEEGLQSAPAENLLGDEPPSTLAAFWQFWLEAPGLQTGPLRARIAPRGPAEPALMVLVVEPERTDSDRLLSGPQGALLARMLQAMGIAQEAVYFASALPAHTPMADTDAIARSGMAAVLAYHIGLVQPRAILAFGSSLAPLLNPEASATQGGLRENNPNSSIPPILVSEALSSLMEMPRLKARFWRRWIEWLAQQS